MKSNFDTDHPSCVTAWQSVNAVCLGCLTHSACVGHWTTDYSPMEATGSASASKRRRLECCHLSMPSPRPAACAGPACVQPDSQFLFTRVYDFLWPVVQSHSDESYACNCSMFCLCIRSGLPHNVVHFVVYKVIYY